MPETNQKEFNGAILISENKDYSAYSPGDATHPLQPIALEPSTENIANSLGKAARWIEVLDEKVDKADNVTAGVGIAVHGDGTTGNAKTIINTGVNSVENTTAADTSATNGDIRIVNKTVNPSTGVVSDSVSYVKPKGISDPAFKTLESNTGSSSTLTDDNDHIPTSSLIKKYVDAAVAGASNYLGTIASTASLSTSAKKGDFYRASTSWTDTTAGDVHVMDMIIAEKNNPSAIIDNTNWSLLHSEPNTDANVAQKAVSTNATYEVLFSHSANNTDEVNDVGKDSGLTYNPSTNKLTISGEVSATSYSGLPEGNTTTKGIVQLGTDADKAASGNHSHGNITNGGAITETGVDLASGDALVFADYSDSSKLKKTSIAFDGATATQALTRKGTWETFNNYTHPTDPGNKHIPANGASGNYLKYGGSSGTGAWAAPLTTWPATAQHTDTLPSTKLIDDRFKTNETNILYVANKTGKNYYNIKNENSVFANTDTLTIQSGTKSVTATVNADGSVTLTGATEGTTPTFILETGDLSKYAGMYLSGAYSDKVFIQMEQRTAPYDIYAKDIGSGAQIASSIPTEANFFIRLSSNFTIPGSITLKPMICDIDAKNIDPSYQPYALPNYDLTRLEAEDRAALAEEIDAGAKNKLQLYPTPGTYTKDGITYIVYSDGSVQADGTCSVATGGNSQFKLLSADSAGYVPNNYIGYIASGCSGGSLGSDPTYGLLIMYSSNGSTWAAQDGIANGGNITIKNYPYFTFNIVVYGGKTIHQRFYPMLATKAAFGVSSKFVPYAKSNYSLTQDKLNRCSKQLTSGSLNDIKDNEIYYAAADVTDMPTSARAWGFVRTTMYGTDKLYGMQEFFSVTDPCESYFRVLRNGTWQSWVKTGG